MNTETIIIKILQNETGRFLFYAFVMYIIFYVFIKKYLDKMFADIKTFSVKQEAMQKTLLTMLYAELKKLFSEAIRHGGKTYEEDETFKEFWNNYVTLGDGHGDELFTKWQAIKFIIEDKKKE